MKKNVAFISLLLYVMYTFSGCVSPFIAANIPCNQPGTTWATEDGKVTFYIIEKGNSSVHGYIQTDEGNVDIVISMSALTSDIDITYKDDFYSTEEDDAVPYFAYWRYKKVRKDIFVVEVLQTVYFQPGEILTFYKIEG